MEYLHIAAPKTQTSLVYKSTNEGGIQTSKTSKSATLRLTRKKFVVVLMSGFFQITVTTKQFPATP